MVGTGRPLSSEFSTLTEIDVSGRHLEGGYPAMVRIKIFDVYYKAYLSYE
jgi:hypothetical protein